MNGLWSGWYGYAGLAGLSQPVAFTAWIDERGGQLAGMILEPNTFSLQPLDDLEADIAGLRAARAVRFAKTYRPGQGVHDHAIQYDGEADARFTHVRGTWSFANAPASHGRFELTRSSRGFSDAILRWVLAPVGEGGTR